MRYNTYMAKKKKSVSIETNDQNFGGTFNAHKNWRKPKAKHEKDAAHKARGGSRIWKPEVYESSAGKGDSTRTRDIPEEIYDINWDLAFGRITKEEHVKRTQQYWEGVDDDME